jgi:hypothetical protein
MIDDPKANEESPKPTRAPRETLSPPSSATAIQTNPTRKATEDSQKPIRLKRKPILRLVQIIRKHRREFPKWTDIAIVVLTGGIVFLAYMQHRDMTESGKQTDKIIAAEDRFATAMENSVTQAQTTFLAANKQAIVTQRAWIAVNVETISLDGSIKGPVFKWAIGQPFDIRISVKNTGRTPALNVREASGTAPVDGKPGTVLFKPMPRFDDDKNYTLAGILTPDGGVSIMDLTYETPLTIGDRNDIISGKLRMFVYGRVLYDDVFGDHHFITFCKLLLNGGGYATCPYHNEIDSQE